MPDVRKPYYCLPTTAIFFMTIRTGQAQSISYVATHPRRKIVVEADTPKEAIAALRAQPDVLQLDKFSPQQATEIAQIAPSLAPHCTLALTGGINLTTLKNYLDCGIRLFITSAPYYAAPADIKVSLQPAASI